MQQKSIGQFIREKRLAAKKSLNAFAASVEVEPAILSRVENGKQDIKFEVLKKIASGFEMDLSTFLKEFENSKNEV